MSTQAKRDLSKLLVMFGIGSVIILAIFTFVSITLAAAKSPNVPRTERDVIVEMHKMANKYIIADEIRGKQEMTQDRLTKLSDVLIEADPTAYPHKKHLLEILTVWQQGEFFMLANDHNYLWEALDGEVGEATGVRTEDLPAWSINN